VTKEDPFVRFRIGTGPGSYSRDVSRMKTQPGTQFPVEGYDNYTKQLVPRWTTTDDAIIAAYTELVDKVCPCVVLIHSQAGQFGLEIAQAVPEEAKAFFMGGTAWIGDLTIA